MNQPSLTCSWANAFAGLAGWPILVEYLIRHPLGIFRSNQAAQLVCYRGCISHWPPVFRSIKSESSKINFLITELCYPGLTINMNVDRCGLQKIQFFRPKLNLSAQLSMFFFFQSPNHSLTHITVLKSALNHNHQRLCL